MPPPPAPLPAAIAAMLLCRYDAELPPSLILTCYVAAAYAALRADASMPLPPPLRCHAYAYADAPPCVSYQLLRQRFFFSAAMRRYAFYVAYADMLPPPRLIISLR